MNGTLTKADLIRSVADDCAITQAKAREVIDNLFKTIEHAVTCGDTVRISSHGTWKPAHRSARTARNPSNGATIHVPAKVVPAFTPAGPFKDRVAGKI